MFFRLVVHHMNSRTWLIYGRLSGHQMFGTNHVVFTWLPPFPCFRIFSIDGFNPRYSPFRVSFKCSKGLKLKQFRTCTVLACTMAIMRRAKSHCSISAADIYCYCNQQQHKPSYPYVKLLFPAIFFLKTRRSSKKLTQSNSKQLETSTFYPDSFPVARNFEIDRWNSELAY